MKKVLIIEDEKILLEMYRDKFKKGGLRIIEAQDAQEGLDVAKKQKPDLIILDILLPRENGLLFLEKKKNIPEISSIPVIAFSNFDDPETKEKAIMLGVKDYIIKSNYTPGEVLEKIKKYL